MAECDRTIARGSVNVTDTGATVRVPAPSAVPADAPLLGSSALDATAFGATA